MEQKEFCDCATCGYRWRRGENGSHSCVSNLAEHLRVTDELLTQRERVLDAIPECPAHGRGCVPHALEWIEEAKQHMSPNTEAELSR